MTDNNGELLHWYPDWSYFDGQIVGVNWSIPTAKLQEGKRVGNFVDLDPGVLICDPFAWICLEKYIQNEVEVLGIDVEGLEMKILNIINIVDCLDENKSEVLYFKDNKRIMHIKKYSFKKEFLTKTMLVKMPQLSRSYIFATDLFREKVLKYKLTGLEFNFIFE